MVSDDSMILFMRMDRTETSGMGLELKLQFKGNYSDKCNNMFILLHSDYSTSIPKILQKLVKNQNILLFFTNKRYSFSRTVPGNRAHIFGPG